VCLYPIGILNPYIELVKNKAQMAGAIGGLLNDGNISMKRELEKWFLWC